VEDVFVLLDDCHASAQQPTSRLYSGFVREHRCTDPQTLDTVWHAVEADQHAGLHAAVFADYEWGAKLQQAGLKHVGAQDTSALRILLFRQCEHLSEPAVAQWLAERDGSNTPSPAGIRDLQPGVTQPRFEQDVERIRELIRCGETYQVNYTLRLHGAQFGTPWGLYRRLRAMQPVAFGVLALLPDAAAAATTSTPGTWVLSSSPELFVRNTAGQLTARPMKGTAARLSDSALDQQRADWLAHDAKNRAENVMIVDLLRNDLGRISETGTVRVPALFAVESYQTVHQMTSTVTATLRSGLHFPDVLRALFPCGSITGAPKLHTMDLIADLESEPRGLYCGAIGWLDAPSQRSPVGDFCLSVAIRTLVLEQPQATCRPATLGVGGGIVLDSRATDEYTETRTKVRYLTEMDPGFTLFETMRVSRGRVLQLALHLQRLRSSAQTLGFAWDEEVVRQSLAQQLEQLDARQNYRLRLDLQHDGGLRLQQAPLLALPVGPAGLVLSGTPVPAHEAALLNHKTSLRSSYDAAIQKAIALQAFDAVFLNAQGEVTEGARSNLLVRLQDRWVTPPLASGVLGGVMRQRLLQRCLRITEEVLTLEQVLSAQALVVCSALRGLQPARWLRGTDGKVIRI
jgi:para-aminobenzoate synthetase / 4-amino-4-deoxychorismate lyase